MEQYLPTADIVFGRFHLVANLGQVIDKIRRRTQVQADAEGRAFLKGQRYNLLCNKESLSAGGRADFKELLELLELLAADRDLSVAYVLKDAFKQVWTSTYRKCADKCLTGWIGMARAASLNSSALPAA